MQRGMMHKGTEVDAWCVLEMEGSRLFVKSVLPGVCMKEYWQDVRKLSKQ